MKFNLLIKISFINNMYLPTYITNIISKMTDNLFCEEEQQNIDMCPIILIDKSASTTDMMENGKDILLNEAMHISNILKNYDIENCNLILWCSRTDIIGNIKVNEIVPKIENRVP